MKKLLFLFVLILVSCNKGEEMMTFNLTTNAIPTDGGTVTLLHTELTKGEFKWGENAIIKAKQSDGYVFSHWSSDTYTGIIGGVINTSHGTFQNSLHDGFAYTSLAMRCYDSKTCPDDIIINAHFVKKD